MKTLYCFAKSLRDPEAKINRLIKWSSSSLRTDNHLGFFVSIILPIFLNTAQFKVLKYIITLNNVKVKFNFIKVLGL